MTTDKVASCLARIINAGILLYAVGLLAVVKAKMELGISWWLVFSPLLIYAAIMIVLLTIAGLFSVTEK